MSTPLFESWNPATLRSTEVETDPDIAGLVITQTQDTKPIVESAKRIAANFDPTVRRDVVHVARIPLVIWRQLQRLGITNDEKALNNWLNGRDQAVFRTDDRSVL